MNIKNTREKDAEARGAPPLNRATKIYPVYVSYVFVERKTERPNERTNRLLLSLSMINETAVEAREILCNERQNSALTRYSTIIRVRFTYISVSPRRYVSESVDFLRGSDNSEYLVRFQESEQSDKIARREITKTVGTLKNATPSSEGIAN